MAALFALAALGIGMKVRAGFAAQPALAIAGVVRGMIATGSGRAMPLLTAGLSMWKLAKNLLPMLRRG